MRLRTNIVGLLFLILVAASSLLFRGRPSGPAVPFPQAPVPKRGPIAGGNSRAHAVLEGKVVSIADGDTLTIVDGSSVERRVRLYGIDSPERSQPFSNAARKSLSTLCFGKIARIEQMATDQYGRVVGKVYVEGRYVNLQQVRAGMAWHYAHYDHSAQLAAAEVEARARRIGLWADPNPVPPWDYRHERQPAHGARPRRH